MHWVPSPSTRKKGGRGKQGKEGREERNQRGRGGEKEEEEVVVVVSFSQKEKGGAREMVKELCSQA